MRSLTPLNDWKLVKWQEYFRDKTCRKQQIWFLQPLEVGKTQCQQNAVKVKGQGHLISCLLSGL